MMKEKLKEKYLPLWYQIRLSVKSRYRDTGLGAEIQWNAVTCF